MDKYIVIGCIGINKQLKLSGIGIAGIIKPSFNPRWNNGTVDYIIVSKIDNPEWGLV